MLPKIVHASYCWLQTGCDWMAGMKNEPYISFQWHGLPIDRVLWLVWLVWGFWATVHMCFIDTGYTEIATHIEVQYFGKYGVRIFENRFVQFNAWATQEEIRNSSVKTLIGAWRNWGKLGEDEDFDDLQQSRGGMWDFWGMRLTMCDSWLIVPLLGTFKGIWGNWTRLVGGRMSLRTTKSHCGLLGDFRIVEDWDVWKIGNFDEKEFGRIWGLEEKGGTLRWGKLTRLVGGENNEVALLLHGRF